MQPARIRQHGKAFSLIELLAVIAVIGLLLAIVIPALQNARQAARQVVCAAQMKQWALATLTYAGESDNIIPPYGDIRNSIGSPTDTDTYWYNRLSPYLTREHYGVWGMEYPIRRCPSARANWGEAAVWVGVYYGHHRPDRAPFIFPNELSGAAVRKMCDPFKLSLVRLPAYYLMMLDTGRDRVQEPVRWQWDTDYDGNGQPDSSSGILAVNLSPYNWAQPKIHRGGCNVALFDGRVEWIRYDTFWEFGGDGYPVHPYWFNQNRP